MFTSRAEHRLLLREDNADLRLTEIGRQLGVVDEVRWRSFTAKREAIERERQRLIDIWVRPQQLDETICRQVLKGPLIRESRAIELLRRPEVNYASLMTLPTVGPGVGDANVAEQVEIQCKYAGYIERQRDEIQRNRRYEEMQLPLDLDYSQVRGLSAEVREKFSQQRPATLGQAGRIPGVTPAAVSLLLVHLQRERYRRSA
jgi:tRNA uridine 5-carboxymethylaminomethyl modification enzyme